MKKYLTGFFIFFTFLSLIYGQELKNTGSRILFHGLVVDADTQVPLPGTQILINKAFSSVSGDEGKFAFYAGRLDTVIFRRLGYKSAILLISDTLTAREFNAGIYMHTDTLSMDEIVIVPRFRNLKSEILYSRSESSTELDNARYNLEVSAYQGKITSNKLGDPAANYELLRQRMREDAYSKGQIPSDRLVGISPLLLFPAAYLLMNGLPENPPPLQPHLTDQEINQIHRKYMERLKKGKQSPILYKISP
jgi:hypothetical protein